MTISRDTLTTVQCGPDRAEVTCAVLGAALDALPLEDDTFGTWRADCLRAARARLSDEADGTGLPHLEPTHVATAIDVCHSQAPTPHDRMVYESQYEEEHPNQPFGEIPVAIQPLLGDELPEVPTDDDV